MLSQVVEKSTKILKQGGLPIEKFIGVRYIQVSFHEKGGIRK